jgi:hypothetical protein
MYVCIYVCMYVNINVYLHVYESEFFLLERPNLLVFAICNNTFSKWWEG